MDMQDTPRYEAYERSTFFRDGMSQRKLPQGTVPRGYLRADSEFYTGKKASQSAQASAGSQSAANTQNQTGREAAGQGGQQNTGGTTTTQNPQAANTGGTTTGGASQVNTTAASMYPDALTIFPMPVTAELLNRGESRYQIFCSACHGLTGYGDGMIVRRGFRRPPSFYESRLREAPVGHFFDVITNGWGAMPRYSSQIPAQDRWAIIAYIRALQMTVPEGQPQTNNASAGQNQNPTPTGGHR